MRRACRCSSRSRTPWAGASTHSLHRSSRRVLLATSTCRSSSRTSPGDVVTFPIRLTPDPVRPDLLNQRLDFGVTSRPCDHLPATTPVRSIHSASDAQAFIRSSTPDGRPSLTLQLAYLSQETYGNLYAENVIRNLGYQLVSQKDAGELHIEAWRAPDGNIVVAFRGTVPTDLTNLVADA